MKKLIVVLISFLLLISLSSLRITSADSDKSSIKDLIVSEYCHYYSCNEDKLKINVTKEKLYDLHLNHIGHVYEFTVNDLFKGFTITKYSKDEDIIDRIIEFTPNHESPYFDKKGLTFTWIIIIMVS